MLIEDFSRSQAVTCVVTVQRFNISETTQDTTRCYYRPLIRSHIYRSVESRRFRWPWVTFKVIHVFRVFSAAIFRWPYNTCAAVEKISDDRVSRGPSARADPPAVSSECAICNYHSSAVSCWCNVHNVFLLPSCQRVYALLNIYEYILLPVSSGHVSRPKLFSNANIFRSLLVCKTLKATEDGQKLSTDWMQYWKYAT